MPGGRFEVLCFPHQAQFLREYIGQLAGIKTIDMDLVEADLAAALSGAVFTAEMDLPMALVEPDLTAQAMEEASEIATVVASAEAASRKARI